MDATLFADGQRYLGLEARVWDWQLGPVAIVWFLMEVIGNFCIICLSSSWKVQDAFG